MVWLIGHRQTKGAATAMPRPTVTALHLYSTVLRLDFGKSPVFNSLSLSFGISVMARFGTFCIDSTVCSGLS
jgi:hypothetical protein